MPQHDWKPVEGQRSTYRCAVCAKVVLRLFGRFTAARSRREWTEACAGADTAAAPQPAPSTPSVLPPVEWVPGSRDKDGRPLAPAVGRMSLSRQQLFELLLVYLHARQRRETYTTGGHFLWMLEELGIMTHMMARKVQKDRDLQSLIIRNATKIFIAYERANALDEAKTALLIRVASDDVANFERTKVLDTYRLILTPRGSEIAERSVEKFARIPWDSVNAWERDWQEWHQLTMKSRMKARLAAQEAEASEARQGARRRTDEEST